MSELDIKSNNMGMFIKNNLKKFLNPLEKENLKKFLKPLEKFPMPYHVVSKQRRYEIMKTESFFGHYDLVKHAPSLQCCECNHFISFGGVCTYQKGKFTINDVCMCWIKK